jgi:patatin-like phospholipase/acyl hydrolase
MRILSIDGGGIRGIIPGQILIALEKHLKTRSGDPTARIGDYFDLIAGTSTGGILTCLYLCPDPERPGRPRFSAEDAVALYFERGAKIFEIPIWHKIASAGGVADEKYPANGLEDAARDYLGELKLSELIRPCLVTAYDITRRRTFFFTQHDARRTDSRNFLVRDVARATSAAPTFFECARVTSVTGVGYPMIDGGIFANNPTLCAYAEARTMGCPTAKDMSILSIGTGDSQKRYDYDSAKDWGALGWIRPVLDIMMSGVAETVDYQLRQMFRAVGAPERYLRIQAELRGEHADMDNAEPQNLAYLKELGTETAEVHAKELETFAGFLV